MSLSINDYITCQKNAVANTDMNGSPKEVRNVELSAKGRNLTSEGMVEKARKIVFGTAYQDAKALINNNIPILLTVLLILPIGDSKVALSR